MADMLPDIIAERLAVVFCGINPGMLAAATGHHFAGRGNRFWRTIHLAGFTPEEILPQDDRTILHYGCGLTAVVDRPTSRADQLSAEEFTLTAAQFEKDPALCAWFHRFSRQGGLWRAGPSAGNCMGRSAGRIRGGAAVWVLPNPSGRNRAFTLDQLVGAYRQFYLAAEPSFTQRA
jgi:TDG/mug DNA glycosylase family protein